MQMKYALPRFLSQGVRALTCSPNMFIAVFCLYYRFSSDTALIRRRAAVFHNFSSNAMNTFYHSLKVTL